MIDYNLDAAHSILYMRPKSALAAEDFVKIAEAVDPHIEATGGLAGVIIEVPEFTGWESKVAVVTDSTLVKLIESLASHFVAAEVRQFPWGETEVANQWILGGS
jgi:hypothetical protein